MTRIASLVSPLCVFSILVLWGCSGLRGDETVSEQQLACEALAQTPNLTITVAQLVEATETTPQYCYMKGVISPAIVYHMQLPLPENWNGRLLNIGDGGKDGDLDFSDERLTQGYAVANSNMGHDNGVEPGASFGFNNRQAEIDFGYRAVHLTANASKSVVDAYYGTSPQYSYFEGCSTGGREGLMEAQRFPYDFDGIVAGAPVYSYQRTNATHVWMLQSIFRDNLAGNLAYDQDGDGVPESLTKFDLLIHSVLDKCDGVDGITDGVIDDPLACEFKPEFEFADKMCPNNINGEACFTTQQIQTIQDIYGGSHDSKGLRIFKGKALGTEPGWVSGLFPHAGNSMSPTRLGTPERPGTTADHVNYLFYENDPGVPLPKLNDLSQVPDKTRQPPEYAWWEFNIDDVTAGKGDLMMSITDATDPDLNRFLFKNDGKLILYHGWADSAASPEPTLDYYKDVVATTFNGDIDAAKQKVQLFMAPGMEHCGNGPGPNSWDKLAPLVEWVENGKAPEFIVATHSTDGVVDNERPICAYPGRAVYTGPAGGANDPANWVASNFACQ